MIFIFNLDYSNIGSKIKSTRLSKKLSQETLAEKCNISTSFLGHIERGTRKMSLETLVSIASVLNISVDYLLSDSLYKNDSSLNAILDYAKNNSTEKNYENFIKIVKILLEGINKL